MAHTLVILESPYGSPDPTVVAANVDYLQKCIRHSVLTCGESPYASHQMLTAALDDCSPEERETGIQAGFAWRPAAVKTVVYLDRGLSQGMVFGIQDALKVGRPVELRAFGPVSEDVTGRLAVLGLPGQSLKAGW
jgi:hypothetical protein